MSTWDVSSIIPLDAVCYSMSKAETLRAEYRLPFFDSKLLGLMVTEESLESTT